MTGDRHESSLEGGTAVNLGWECDFKQMSGVFETWPLFEVTWEITSVCKVNNNMLLITYNLTHPLDRVQSG